MRPERSLRVRFVWALTGLVGLLLASFAIALGLFVEVLEDELLTRVVTMELHEMSNHSSASQGAVDAAGLRRWTVPAGDQRKLPAPLRTMDEGTREITWDDGTYVFAGKLVAQGEVYAIVADIQGVERLERRLVQIGVVTALGALLLSMAIAAWLARTTLRPIVRLVDRLTTLDPARPQPLYDTDLQTAEARLIARAVDSYQQRIGTLLERERSLTDDISHELRTPTSVIATSAELLLDDATVTGAARKRVGRIARAARRTASVVEALLFLGRDDSVNAPVSVDLRAVVSDTVEVYLPIAQAKGLALHAAYGDEQVLSAPAGAVSIVLQNLIENAIRFTDRGYVRVTLARGRLAVEDTGVGLAGVDKARIFERGYRGDASHGSGLGLDLIRRVCDRAGWHVSVHERAEGGSRFEVAFAAIVGDAPS